MFMPKYKAIIDDILSKIKNGDLEAGMKLPSQRNLAAQYRVNRSTIIQSLEILQSYGILESKARKGLYVSKSNWNTYINHNMNWHDYIKNSASKNNQYFIAYYFKLYKNKHINYYFYKGVFYDIIKKRRSLGL